MLIKKYFLPKNFDLFIYLNYSILLIKGLNGLALIKLPSVYYLKKFNKNISLIFINKFLFVSFLSILKTTLKNLYYYYFFRLKLRGLGFRIRKITNNLYKFFFTSTNFFYLHLPLQIIVKLKKKNYYLFLIISVF